MQEKRLVFFTTKNNFLPFGFLPPNQMPQTTIRVALS